MAQVIGTPLTCLLYSEGLCCFFPTMLEQLSWDIVTRRLSSLQTSSWKTGRPAGLLVRDPGLLFLPALTLTSWAVNSNTLLMFLASVSASQPTKFSAESLPPSAALKTCNVWFLHPNKSQLGGCLSGVSTFICLCLEHVGAGFEASIGSMRKSICFWTSLVRVKWPSKRTAVVCDVWASSQWLSALLYWKKPLLPLLHPLHHLTSNINCKMWNNLHSFFLLPGFYPPTPHTCNRTMI